MSDLVQDLRYGLRAMIRNPGFTAVLILILALGIGATSSIVSVLDAVLFNSLPYKEADRLVLLNSAREQDGEAQTMPISYLDFEDWQAQSGGVFESMALYSAPQSFNLLMGGEARHVRGELVGADYFRLLGVEARGGRTFAPQEDETPGEPRISVVSQRLWADLYGEDGGFEAGKSILLNGESYEVVGVMPPGFAGLSDDSELWLPLMMTPIVMGPPFLEVRPFRWLLGAGRLADGVSIEAARAALATVTAALANEYPDTNGQVGALVTPLFEAWFGDLRLALFILLGAAAFVLLIACNNVANLLVSRALARQREMALRSALGATRRRLVRQLLTENVLLALLAAVLGLFLAWRFTDTLVSLSAIDLQSFVEIGIDLKITVVILLIAVVAGLGFGLVPALLVSRVSLQEHLKEGSKGSAEGVGRRRFQSFLVIAKVTLALVLLIGSGIMAQGFSRLRQADLGFETDRLMTARLFLKDPQYQDPEVVRSLSRQLLESLEGLPGAASATIAGPSIPSDAAYGGNYLLEGQDSEDPRNRLLLVIHHVSPDYFENLGASLVAGRGFTSADGAQSLPVAVVSRAMAERAWPGESAVGKRLRPFRGPPDAPWLEVVGVAEDIQHVGLIPDPQQPPDIYFPLLQTPPQVAPILNLLVRSKPGTKAETLTASLVQAVRDLAPHLPAYDPQTMDQRLAGQVGRERFLVLVMGLFTVLALILAALGIYGLFSFTVAQRTREIGIRLALGATPGSVLKNVIGRALTLTGIGLALGMVVALVLSFALGRWLENLFHGMGGIDVWTIAATVLVLLAAAFLASFLPARRASRIEPMNALRVE